MLDLFTVSRGARRPDSERGDYPVVRRVIECVASHPRASPSLEDVSEHLGLAASHLRLLFARWAGSTPEAFLRAITAEHRRDLLCDVAGVIEAARHGAVSDQIRPRELFVTHEATKPGDDRHASLRLSYGFHPSPFGESIIVAAPRGLAGLGFVDDGDRAVALADMRRRWPLAALIADHAATAPLAARAFDPRRWRPDAPERVVLIGGAFERLVWEVLLMVPMGRATTYSDIARHLGKPTAARAVGGAVARNPISFVVPCHRVLGRSGALTGYHWGLTRKQAMIAWEAGRTAG